MSGPQRPFDPAELRDPSGGGPSDTELAGLLSTARTLEDVARADAAPPSGGFTDRVMDAVAAEPPPRRAGAIPFVGPFVLALTTAWRTATSGDLPLAVRTPALALVLLVAVAAASLGTMATVGVAGFLSGEPATPPSVRPERSGPLVAPSEVAPVPSPSLTPSPSPSPSATPSPTPSPSPTSAAPTGTPDDDTDEPRETDEPKETDEPDETDEARADEPRETDEPEETDDHGEGESSEGEP